MKMEISETHFTSVPAFLSKLWALVDDPSTNDLIYWDATGRSFHVSDQMRFSKEILPMHFKHNNISSFIRQLNMYGFRKVMASDSLSLKTEKEDLEFAHQYFVRGQEYLLEAIKRKTSTQGHSLPQMSRTEVNKIIGEVSSLKQHIDSVTDSLESLKLENDILWKEMIDLRQKHARQQEVVSKLLQFFASIINSDRTPIKRKLPLMLQNSAPDSASSLFLQQNCTGKNKEPDERLSPIDLTDFNLPVSMTTPLSSDPLPSSTPPPDHSAKHKSTDKIRDLVVKQEPKVLLRDFSREEISKNLDTFQDSLNSLYELLSNNNNNSPYGLDLPLLEKINGMPDFLSESNSNDGEIPAKRSRLAGDEESATSHNNNGAGMELCQYIPPEDWLNLHQISDAFLNDPPPSATATTTTDPDAIITDVIDLSDPLTSSLSALSDKDAFSEYVFEDEL